MDIVIGSGPAGLATASALLERGRQVTMLDGGKTLPPDALERKKEFAQTPAAQWSDAQKNAWRAPQFSPSDDRVHRYGSNHAQETLDGLIDPQPDWFAARASHAVGGFSNVWGSAVLPNRQADIEAWPITADQLAPHYKAVSELVPISGRSDALDTLLPAFSMKGRKPLQAGPQGRKLLDRLEPLTDQLQAAGVHVGQARQAVRADCQYCGMCLHGCPWDQIFSAAHGLGALLANPNFEHLPGRLVRAFEEQGDEVIVHLESGERLTGSRLFIGAGVLETARIVLASGADPKPVRIQDSRHFFLPFLHAWTPDKDPEHSPHHTLTEAFVEIDDPDVSPFLTHTQIYGWNAFFSREMVANYGSRIPFSAGFFKWLAKRLMVAQTFIHSDHCAEIELTRSPGKDTLSAKLIDKPETDQVVGAARKKLSASLRKAGLHAVSIASRMDPPGSSFHFGGTFPMQDTPGAQQTDSVGRLNGTKNVHLIDASVLPSIPATTITFSVMANAHRIGTLA